MHSFTSLSHMFLIPITIHFPYGTISTFIFHQTHILYTHQTHSILPPFLSLRTLSYPFRHSSFIIHYLTPVQLSHTFSHAYSLCTFSPVYILARSAMHIPMQPTRILIFQSRYPYFLDITSWDFSMTASGIKRISRRLQMKASSSGVDVII